MSLKGVTSFVIVQGLAILVAFSSRADVTPHVSSNVVSERWENVSRGTAISASSKKLQKAARDLSAAVGLEDRSVMVQIYKQSAAEGIQEIDILAEQMLREVYWGPMAPDELKVKSLGHSNQDLESALTLVTSDLPNLQNRESRGLAVALSGSISAGNISRIAFEFTADGGRCLGLLLISEDQKQVVEIANCLTK